MKYLIILSSLLLIECQTSSTIDQHHPIETEELFADYYQDYLSLNPLIASIRGFNDYNDRVENFYSSEYIEQKKNFYFKYLELARSVEKESLSQSDELNLNLLIYECELQLKILNAPFPKGYQYFRTEGSLHQVYGILAGGTIQPFNSVKDYENWLKRMDGFIQIWDSSMLEMRNWIISGHVHPRPLIEKIIAQFEQLAKRPIEENIVFRPIQSFPDSISVAQQERLTNLYSQKGIEMLDKFNEVVVFLKEEYLPAGRETSGIGELPVGKEFYDLLILKNTTVNISADEIFELGLEEVDRIREEMEKIKTNIGYEYDLESFFEYVKNKPELKPFNEPEEVIANFNKIHERMLPYLDSLFGNKPSASFEVRRVEESQEASSPYRYAPAAIDGSRPGIFYVPIPNVREYNILMDESTFLHEAIPGHHYQISLQNENDEIPDFRKAMSFSAYTEGWALYTETLGRELGLYEDPYQYFGALTADMHRAIRLVVDVGIHVKGWTREEAIEFSLKNEAESEENIISEIERYMGDPGKALSYKIGQLKIMELKDKAKTSLGDKFEVRAFHNIILSIGSVPLEVLENVIDDWIEDQTNGS